MKHIFIKLPDTIYPADIVVFFGKNREHLYKEMKPLLTKGCLKELKSISYGAGTCVPFDNGLVLIVADKPPKSAMWKGILAHEIFHATCFIMKYIGSKLTGGAKDPYAYLLEFITRSIYEQEELWTKTK